MKYWLFKSEPIAYSLADLQKDGETSWDGVRNYQARNYMRDQMKIGDQVLFYHSSTNPMAIVGTAVVSGKAHPDQTALDASSHHYDPSSTPENPIWYMVDISYKSTFIHPVTLTEAKSNPELQGMILTQRGSRLSIQPVSKEHFEVVCALGTRQ